MIILVTPVFFFFFKSVVTRMADLNWSPVYSDHFHLSYQKHFYLCHFILEFSIMWKHFIYHRHKAFLNIAETVANDRPINIYIYINTFTLKAFYAPSKRSTKQCF